MVDVVTRARDSRALEQRIETQKSSSLDLNKWIVEQLELSSRDTVLELCCGRGAQTQAISSVFDLKQYKAVDVSPESVDAVKALNLPDFVEVICSDANIYVEKETQDFDLVLCCYGFYYLQKPLACLQAIKSNLLKSGGQLFLVGPSWGNNSLLFDILKKCDVAIPDFVFWSSEYFMGEALSQLNSLFEEVIYKKITNYVEFSSSSEFLQYWKNTTFYSERHEKRVFEEMDMLEYPILLNKHVSSIKAR